MVEPALHAACRLENLDHRLVSGGVRRRHKRDGRIDGMYVVAAACATAAATVAPTATSAVSAVGTDRRRGLRYGNLAGQEP